MNKLEQLKYFVIDVDGTMTDGGVYFDEEGRESKKFCTRDAAAFFVAHYLGIEIIVITGRESLAAKKRLTELKVDHLFQAVRDKKQFLRKFMDDHKISQEELGYIGDDLNDFPAMSLASFVGCPKDSCKEVKSIAHYVSPVCGGDGAVRDIVEYVLSQRGEWAAAIKKVYNTGI